MLIVFMSISRSHTYDIVAIYIYIYIYIYMLRNCIHPICGNFTTTHVLTLESVSP